MVNVFFPLLLFLFAGVVAYRLNAPRWFSHVLFGGFALRMVLQLFLREVPVFSHGVGGDYLEYEVQASYLAHFWEIKGIFFATQNNTPFLFGQTVLPQNLFAMLFYLNGGYGARAACVAVLAFLAVLTMANFFKIALLLGAEERPSAIVATVMYLSPVYLFHTSDMFKDGIVLFLVLTAFGSSFRLVQKWTVGPVLAGFLSLWALWYVRYYLIFLTIAPLVIGILWVGRRAWLRGVISCFILIPALLLVASQISFSNTVFGQAETTFDLASGADAREFNASGKGSGVTFNDGGKPFGALVPKVLYTLFSPFPWQLGSLGFQIGKIDTLVWYFLFYRMLIAVRILWREDRGRLFAFLVFIVPCTIAYATTMANIGLMMRQRMPVIFISTLLAMRSWGSRRQPENEEKSEKEALASSPSSPSSLLPWSSPARH